MPNIRLRSAIAADRPLIRQLIVENNLNPWGLHLENFTVAVDEQDQFVGCGQIKRHGSTEELASLVVVKAWQGRGVSKVLMDALMSRAKRPLWLMCESPLTEYYSRYGFNEISTAAELPGYFQAIYWASRAPSGLMMLFRGTYVAFMRLDA